MKEDSKKYKLKNYDTVHYKNSWHQYLNEIFLDVRPYCNTYEPRQWPEWEDIHEDEISGPYLLVATNSSLVELRVHSTGG